MKKFALRHDYEIDLDFKNKPMTCNFSTTKPFLDLWDDRTKLWLIVVRILRGFPHAEFEAIHQRISFISVRHRKRCFLASKSTDLGSLIWIFDCENLAIFQPLWFYVKINCGWFQKVKNCHFNNFGGLDFFERHLKMSKFRKNSNVKAAKIFENGNWFHVKLEWQENC